MVNKETRPEITDHAPRPGSPTIIAERRYIQNVAAVLMTIWLVENTALRANRKRAIQTRGSLQADVRCMSAGRTQIFRES